MYKTFAISALIIGVFIVIAAAIFRPGSPSRNAASTQIKALSPALVKKFMLDATLKNGQISGRFFNPNVGVTVTNITIEATLKDEGSSPSKSLPRIFNVAAIAQPQAMSSEFRVKASALDPERYTLRITGAFGGSSPL